MLSSSDLSFHLHSKTFAVSFSLHSSLSECGTHDVFSLDHENQVLERGRDLLKVTHKAEADLGPESRCPSHPASAAPTAALALVATTASGQSRQQQMWVWVWLALGKCQEGP